MATKPIVIALKKAGVDLRPLNQRVWQWVKDNGPHSSKQVATAMKELQSSVSSVLGDMCFRGMLIKTKEKGPRSSGKGPGEYFVYAAVAKLKTYELLPHTQAWRDRVKRQSSLSRSSTALVPAPAPAPAPSPAATQGSLIPSLNMLDKLSVREAYSLYLELKTMFNPSSAA